LPFAEREFREDTARDRLRGAGADHRRVREALGILRKYRSQLERGAKLLLEKETLTREELPLLQELQPPIAAASGIVI